MSGAKQVLYRLQLGLNRQGSQVSSLGNPLGPNRPAASEASAGLRQTAPPLGMQLPLGSVITNPPIQPLTHHSGQLQSQTLGGHFQQQLPNSRAYQIPSFTSAVADASQPLTAPSMHSLPPHASSQGFSQPQGFFSQPLSSQGPGFMTSQGFSQPQQVQGSSLQPQPAQAFFSQPQSSQGFFPHSQGQSLSARTGQGAFVQPQAGQNHRSLPNGVGHGESLPDGSAHLPSSLPGTSYCCYTQNLQLACCTVYLSSPQCFIIPVSTGMTSMACLCLQNSLLCIMWHAA